MSSPTKSSLQVLVISGNSGLRRSIELTLRRAGMAIIGTDSLLDYLEHWKDDIQLLHAVVLEAGEADPATIGRIQILASVANLPPTLLVAGSDTLRHLKELRRRPEIEVLAEPFTSELLINAVEDIARRGPLVRNETEE